MKNIEGYQAFGASTFDLSGLNEPEALELKAIGANGEEEEGHLLKYLYSVKTGSGSSVVGSNYDDAIEVSYYQNFNEPVLVKRLNLLFLMRPSLVRVISKLEWVMICCCLIYRLRR